LCDADADSDTDIDVSVINSILAFVKFVVTCDLICDLGQNDLRFDDVI